MVAAPLRTAGLSMRQSTLAWSPDGRRLAVVHRGASRPQLTIMTAEGSVLTHLRIGTGGGLGKPTWTADGALVFLKGGFQNVHRTLRYPASGRRIVVLETASGRLLDLTPPRWDAYASVSPDGSRILLTNGRGGFWIAPIERREGGE